MKSEIDKMGKFDKYEVESACDTLIRAEEIKKNPELMEQVSKVLQKKKKAISSLAELSEAKQKMMSDKKDMMEEDEEESEDA